MLIRVANNISKFPARKSFHICDAYYFSSVVWEGLNSIFFYELGMFEQ